MNIVAINKSHRTQVLSKVKSTSVNKTYHGYAMRFRNQIKTVKRVEGRAARVLKALCILNTGGRSDDQTPEFVSWFQKRESV